MFLGFSSSRFSWSCFALPRSILCTSRGPTLEWSALEGYLTMHPNLFILTIIILFSCFRTVKSQRYLNTTLTKSLVSVNPSRYQAASTPGLFNITLSRTLSYATSQASSDSASNSPDGPTSTAGASDSLTTTILTTRYLTITRTVHLLPNTLYPGA